ncbi:MAG: UbiA family prenyltransferase [Gemmataceae bacterium]|nr:UbiA family prenyltransferase [Gemmataceae bacterium]MDW8265246.1 UbiA family prenyltransferase [Gemmataceae bacterium]
MTQRLRALAQLVRLANVPTALADISLGGLATGQAAQRWPAFLLLLGSSACLYMAGMVWNDVCDVEQDRRERPGRPIPSGRVSRVAAARWGGGLLLGGTALAAAAGAASACYQPPIVAAALVAAILLYDAWLKRTLLGPLAMGSCRFLNVLLGLSLAPEQVGPWGWHFASVVGLYIAGVTWFARTEARQSSPRHLLGAALIMLASLALALPLPLWFSPGTSSPLFPYLLVGVGFLVGHPVRQAIAAPRATAVQKAVKRALWGLVLLDAALATAVAGTAGLFILLWLIPIMVLGRWRWLYAT